jgi:choline-sulfatase
VRDKSQYQSDIETQEAVSFLKKDHAAPFVLVVSYYPPHKPYDPPMRDEQIYRDKGVPHPDYWGGVTAIDREVGVVLKALKDSGCADDTLVLFMADHGETFGERMGSEDKTVCYDDSSKVPLLFSWPGGLPKGLVYNGGVTTLDLMPTILESAGVSIPARAQGKSLLREIRRRELGWKEPVFIENITQKKIDGSYAVERAVRTQDWKLILRDHPQDELYNLNEDPGETKNLLTQPELVHRKRELASQLKDWGMRMGDPVSVKLASRYA